MNSAVEDTSQYDCVELRIPCSPQWVALARLAASGVANHLDFSIDDIEDVKLAVAEACAAAIQHERHGDVIEVLCEVHADALRIRVRDAGHHRTAAENGRTVDMEQARGAGLGIFVIRSLVDELRYGVDPEVGTDFIMTKKPAGT